MLSPLQDSHFSIMDTSNPSRVQTLAARYASRLPVVSAPPRSPAVLKTQKAMALENVVRMKPGSLGVTYRNARARNQLRPRAAGKGGATSYQLRQYAEATLGGGSLRKVVKLPEGEDENEWLAVNSKSTPSTGRKRTSDYQDTY